MEKGYKNLELEANLLALDNRPCSYKYFSYICKQTGIFSNIFLSKENIFNKNYNQKNKIKKFFIFSLDNFIFNGIVNSRKIEYLQKKDNYLLINQLFDFLENNKDWDFYFYISIPRILLNFKDNIEEILKINENFTKFFKDKTENLLSAYEKYSNFKNEKENYILSSRKEKLEIIEFFFNNFLKKKFSNVKEILIVLDDSQIKGLNFLEIDYLKNKYKNLVDSSILYFLIGLDEIHLLILAKIINKFIKKVDKINFYSNSEIKYKFSIYEAVSFKKLLNIYEKYLNVDFVEVNEKEYYWKLFGSRKQKEASEQIKNFSGLKEFLVYFEKINVKEFLKDISEAKYVADLTYANGASLEILKYYLLNWNRIFEIDSFWAWNTLANTLGSSISHYIISKNLETVDYEIKNKLVIENFIEALYQTVVRHFAKIQKWNLQEVKLALEKIFSSFSINLKIHHLSFPWNRYFEIDVKI